MHAHRAFESIASQIPAAAPRITAFPSGAVMLDLVIHGESYCAEYLPSFDAYGLSRTAGSSPFWEGVDEAFSSAEALEARILQLLMPNRLGG